MYNTHRDIGQVESRRMNHHCTMLVTDDHKQHLPLRWGGSSRRRHIQLEDPHLEERMGIISLLLTVDRCSEVERKRAGPELMAGERRKPHIHIYMGHDSVRTWAVHTGQTRAFQLRLLLLQIKLKVNTHRKKQIKSVWLGPILPLGWAPHGSCPGPRQGRKRPDPFSGVAGGEKKTLTMLS